MTLNFFTQEQGFQKPLIDPSSQIGSKKDYTTSLKKNAFNTSNAAENNKSQDLRRAEQKEQFSEMMSSLKKKESAQNKDKVQTADAKENMDAPKEDIRASLNIAGAQNTAFYTEESALATRLNDIEPGADTEESLINIANITALNAEIQRLINEHSDNQDSDIQNQILVTANSEPEEIESIFALLASFLSEEDDGKASTDSDLASTLEAIEDIASSEGAQAITGGMTPEQLTQLQDKIQKYLRDELDQRDQEALETLAAQFITLSPPSDKNVQKAQTQSSLQTMPEETMAPVPKEHFTQERYDNRYDSKSGKNEKAARPETSDADKGNVKSALKETDVKTPSSQAAKATNDNTQSAGQKFLQMTNLAQGITPPTEGSTTQGSNVTAAQSVQSPLQSSLSNVITQSQNAGSTHPATQMVSATIQKAVKAGEETNIKLRLDPPELGRVEVKMSIDKDNMTKIVLTAEKPETYMLLKQDAEILERALNNAGLDTEGSLSFEMASEDHDFGQDSKQGHKQTGNSANSDAQDENLIETTMDWQVDPDTGRLHYNVLV